MPETLVRITAYGSRSFCAGLILKEGRVVRAAPILRYLVGADELRVERWARKNGMKMERNGMMADIVEELDNWLAADMPGDDRGRLRRARDEIVTWRIGPFALAMTERGKFIRNEALEEAAVACEAYGGQFAGVYALLIRRLKEQP